MIHFVCRQWCGLINWVEFCQEVFGQNKHLCVREFADHYHLHFHGMTHLSDTALKAIKSKYLHKHSAYTGDEKLFAAKKGEATENGFNYILKDSRSVILSTTLTPEEIAAYVTKSQDHVIKLKRDTKEFVHKSIDNNWGGSMDEDKFKRLVRQVKKHLIYRKVDVGKSVVISAITSQAYMLILSHPRAKVEDWAEYLV